MSRYNGGWPRYVPVAERRRKAERAMEKLHKKGQPVAPVKIEGRVIAATFWGKAWCDNLESYRDYESRLPRGRTYVRNGSVVDLQIAPREVTAMVSGSSIYRVAVSIGAVPKMQWQSICADCSSGIDSLVELLQGRLSKGVMERLCRQNTGLFPKPSDIRFTCSCPDFASMCKHVAAVLYGIGARLDHQPELLFTLRNVDQQDLIANAGSGLSKKGKPPAGAKVLASDDLSEMFGIEMAPATTPARAAAGEVATKRSRSGNADASSRAAGLIRPAKPKEPAPGRRERTQRLTPAKRRAISERMRKYWAARRGLVKKQKASTSS
jgi:uncharacterized Zn finger protein